MNDALSGRPERINDLLYLTAGGPAPDPVQRINALYFLAPPQAGVPAGAAGRQWSLLAPSIGSAGGGAGGMALGAPALLPGYTGSGGRPGDIGPAIQDALSGSRVGEWYRPVRQQAPGSADQGGQVMGRSRATPSAPLEPLSVQSETAGRGQTSVSVPYSDPMTGFIAQVSRPTDASSPLTQPSPSKNLPHERYFGYEPGQFGLERMNSLLLLGQADQGQPSQKQVRMGLIANAVAGANEGIANTLGFPVDLVTGTINVTTRDINDAAGTNIRPITEPFGGSAMWKRAMGLIGANPDDIVPDGLGQVFIRGGTRGATEFLLPGGGASVALRNGGVDVAADIAKSTVSSSARSSTRTAAGPQLRTPTPVEPRTFEADYPNGVQVDTSGRLLADIEGRPLSAPIVIGRQRVGEADIGIPQELDSGLGIAEALSQRSVTLLPPNLMPGLDGAVVMPKSRSKGADADLRVLLRNDLMAGRDVRVLGHENGHLTDQIAGEIPILGLGDELGQLYSQLNRPNAAREPIWPVDFGYTPKESGRELMAEAIRAYMADPNFLKTVAPRTAARIREYVNTNPRLIQILQFNSVLGGLLGARAAVGNTAENEREN